MGWQIERLTLEVTRRCNLKCAHCMRGPARREQMTERVVDNLLKNVSWIGTVTFTGGEPTLNIPIIKYFYQACAWRNIHVETFYIVTNGLKYSQELVDILDREYLRSYEPGLCGLCVSKDYFHDVAMYDKKQGHSRHENNYWKYYELPYYMKDKEYFFHINRKRDSSVDYDRLCLMGNALPMLGYEEEMRDICGKCNRLCKRSRDEDRLVEGEFYVGANGDVNLCSDLSYKEQKRRKIGNVLTDDFNTMILNKVEVER